mmetsp:Transcript_84736/g.263617  ORF Transcript_84736/g.263617 Transcript_84736/m.263617 type:complete len:286 (-) Transcript_84736:119-976(-)
MGRFVQEAIAHRQALEVLRGQLGKLKDVLAPADKVLASTAQELSGASGAADALAEGETESSALAEQLRRAASALGALQAQHEELRASLLAIADQGQAGAGGDPDGAARRPKPREARGKSRPPAQLDLSAFTRGRWEAERLKGASMMGCSEAGDAGETGSSGIKVFMQDIPRPFPPEKPCTQVKGRHIMVNTAEKIRKIYVEISLSGTPDRVGFIRGANLAKFSSLAMERSDCPTGKKGGDLGWIVKGKVDAKLEEVALVTPRGACSPPFKVANSFHLFLCEERKG